MQSALSQRVDRISNMPEALIDDILMRLTTLEAAKICILSKQWRYKWAKLPHLIFDNALWKGLELLKDHREIKESNEESTSKFLRFLDQVFLHHEGPTTKLSFIVPELKSYSRVDRLIDLLSDHGVEEFTFELNDDYELPPSLFSYSQLKHLKLVECWICPPLTFKGFHRLVRLELYNVCTDDEVIESLVSSSPKLEHLVVGGAVVFQHFEIVAPALKFFDFRCACATICFKRTPRLETVKVMVCDPDIVNELSQHGNCNFVEFFDSLPALRKLSMGFYVIRVLAAYQVQARLPTLLIHLKTLKLYDICFDDLYELSCVISLIRSSPNLKELKMTGRDREASVHARVLEFLEVQDYSNVVLNQLQKVTLFGIAGKVPEIALIKLLLEKSSKLESMVIHYSRRIQPDNIEGRKAVEEVNNFNALSPYAKVIHEC